MTLPPPRDDSDPTQQRSGPFLLVYFDGVTRNYSDAKARNHAVELITYFQPLAAKSQRDVWRDGLATASEWLRLIEAPDRMPQDILTLVDIAHANVFRSSGWLHLAGYIRRWAEMHGYKVPTPQEFFDKKAYDTRTRPPKKWWQVWK